MWCRFSSNWPGPYSETSASAGMPWAEKRFVQGVEQAGVVLQMLQAQMAGAWGSVHVRRHEVEFEFAGDDRVEAVRAAAADDVLEDGARVEPGFGHAQEGLSHAVRGPGDRLEGAGDRPCSGVRVAVRGAYAERALAVAAGVQDQGAGAKAYAVALSGWPGGGGDALAAGLAVDVEDEGVHEAGARWQRVDEGFDLEGERGRLVHGSSLPAWRGSAKWRAGGMRLASRKSVRVCDNVATCGMMTFRTQLVPSPMISGVRI